MEPSANEFDRLLLNVANINFDDETIKLLGHVAESTETSHRFVEALLESQSPSGHKDAVSVFGTMRILEELAESSGFSATTLMAHLWLNSNALNMHDICDSIDIWLLNCKSPALSEHLLMLASLQGDDIVRRHFEQMVG